MVPGYGQYILNAQAEGGQQIGLQGQAVAVPAGQGQYRLQALIEQGPTQAQGGHAHPGGVVIRDHHPLDLVFKRGNLFLNYR